MGRLIIVSNRVSVATAESGGAQGGLAVALFSALREQRGFWFGWSGKAVDTFTGVIDFQKAGGVTTATIDLEQQDIEEYYDGYANRTLWPLFHYRVDLTEYERDFAAGYDRVNERFADTLLPLIEPDDVIWVQDYHLIPLGAALRRRGCRNRIGFFLHIPWPPRRLLATLPQAPELVRSMFAYDLVGFHTTEWMHAFRDFAVLELDADEAGDLLTLGEETTAIMPCPIGIDTAEFVELAGSVAARLIARRVRLSASGRDVIVGVDRLDYSKGLPERFAGYERFLATYPSERKEVVLLQVAPPSRTAVGSYQQIRAELEAQAGRINGAFSDLDWVPIRYVNQGYCRDELAGLYRASKIALITPLRDGMNLVAKEYVAAQDPADPGVLILSRFAGAAAQMAEALLVNPHSAEELADALVTALRMSKEERIRRWRALMDGVEREDILWWRRSFIDRLDAIPTREAAGGKRIDANAREPRPALALASLEPSDRIPRQSGLG